MVLDEHLLHRKLRRVEALLEGATTPGERTAAEHARRRLLRRLEEARAGVRTPGPLPDLEHRDHDGGLDTAIDPPTADTLAHLLERWREGALTSDRLCDWAAWYVDKALLPEHPPEDPRSIPVEVLLQLSSLRAQPLTPDDVPALLRFLRAAPDAAAEAWRDWFDYVDGIDWEARKRHRRPLRSA